MRQTLIDLANNPNFISGIYNYCDRWCERCPFTSRCMVYASEKEDDDGDPQTRDITNEAFWRKLASIFEETKQMMADWAEEAGIDLSQVDEAANEQREKRRSDAARDELALAATDYAGTVTKWFTGFDQVLNVTDLAPNEPETDEMEQVEEAREVIHWYQYQIAVKLMRALSSRSNEAEWPAEAADDEAKDSDGSAKVTLIAIDRSVSAWRLIQICLPERADSIIPMILELERLRQRTELKFPKARDFIRPGFDEVLGDAN
ncbi:MAG TPA: hypothetical protein VES69_02065 [Pyrinomonadaceae bacterium]|nr:hypothetical protein [Pyrinomonadaceae bacterium]